MEDIKDVWVTNRHPGRSEPQEDQVDPETNLLEGFKKALQAHPSASSPRNYFQGAPDDLLTKLHGKSNEPSYPLSPFDKEEQVPSTIEINHLRAAVVERFLPTCPFLALGAIIIKDLPRGQHIWHLASKTLIASLTMDNRRTRDINTPLAWLFLGTVGVLSSDLQVWHSTNNLHGCFDAIAKSALTRLRELNPTDASGSSYVVFHMVMIDALRCLHFNMPTSTLCALTDISLGPSRSLSSLISQTLFSGPQADWPTPTQDNALLMLLLILNQIISWAREMLPLSDAGKPARHQTRNHLHEEARKCLVRIERALEKWKSCYGGIAKPETLALLYFCNMHLRVPYLHRAAVQAGYGPLTEVSVKPWEDQALLTSKSAGNLDEASHFAWLVLEYAPEPPPATAVWLPIILYLAGLTVWSHIISQGTSRSRGSLKVLELFGQKLMGLPWPCCDVFARNLETLSSRRQDVAAFSE